MCCACTAALDLHLLRSEHIKTGQEHADQTRSRVRLKPRKHLAEIFRAFRSRGQ